MTDEEILTHLKYVTGQMKYSAKAKNCDNKVQLFHSYLIIFDVKVVQLKSYFKLESRIQMFQ